jgi:hypothetical protein
MRPGDPRPHPRTAPTDPLDRLGSVRHGRECARCHRVEHDLQLLIRDERRSHRGSPFPGRDCQVTPTPPTEGVRGRSAHPHGPQAAETTAHHRCSERARNRTATRWPGRSPQRRPLAPGASEGDHVGTFPRSDISKLSDDAYCGEIGHELGPGRSARRTIYYAASPCRSLFSGIGGARQASSGADPLVWRPGRLPTLPPERVRRRPLLFGSEVGGAKKQQVTRGALIAGVNVGQHRSTLRAVRLRERSELIHPDRLRECQNNLQW